MKHVQDRLNALLDRELSLAETVRVRCHLVRCADCRQKLRQYRAIRRVACNLRRLPSLPNHSRRRLRLGVVAGLAVVALAFLWPRTNSPVALVYGKDPLSAPISALYREGDFFVVRDLDSGRLLGSAPQMDQNATYHMISSSLGGSPAGPRPFRIKLEEPPQDVIMLRGNGPSGEHETPTILFFFGPPPNGGEFFNISVPGPEPRFFVKVLDPKLMNFLQPGDFLIEAPKERTKPIR